VKGEAVGIDGTSGGEQTAAEAFGRSTAPGGRGADCESTETSERTELPR
jgi:hypothetical protein